MPLNTNRRATISLTLSAYSQETVEGVTMPATINVKSQKLVLNGAGLREKLFLDIGSLQPNIIITNRNISVLFILLILL